MERYKVIVAYDGTQFEGFQRQGRARTVQAEFEAALRHLDWQGSTILASGRTDSGVHAEGQVVSFDLEWNHPPEALQRALNARLPHDVVARHVEVVADTFHPRYNAEWRCYHYFVLFSPVRDPLRDRYAWRVWPPLDLTLMQAAANLLPGTHDFAAFGTPPRPGGSTIREVYRAEWQEVSLNGSEAGLRFEVTANAFLYHMVRRMVFVQVLVGRQRLSLDALKAGVQQAQPMTPGLALPQGLYLKEVHYAAGPVERFSPERRQITEEE